MRQSRAYVEHCGSEGIEARPLELGGADHFDAVLELADPGSRLTRATVELVQSV
jgi:hypothetical protein